MKPEYIGWYLIVGIVIGFATDNMTYIFTWFLVGVVRLVQIINKLLFQRKGVSNVS